MQASENKLIIFLTFFIAFILMLLPMPFSIVWYRPAWILLVLIYWTMMRPQFINMGCAFFLGILMDVINGTVLGEHALSLVIVIYFVDKIYYRLRLFPLIQQSMLILLFVWLYQLLLFCTQGFLGRLPETWHYWGQGLTSMLIWPWLSSIIKHSRYPTKIA